jgi:hypothetical protein
MRDAAGVDPQTVGLRTHPSLAGEDRHLAQKRLRVEPMAG